MPLYGKELASRLVRRIPIDRIFNPVLISLNEWQKKVLESIAAVIKHDRYISSAEKEWLSLFFTDPLALALLDSCRSDLTKESSQIKSGQNPGLAVALFEGASFIWLRENLAELVGPNYTVISPTQTYQFLRMLPGWKPVKNRGIGLTDGFKNKNFVDGLIFRRSHTGGHILTATAEYTASNDKIASGFINSQIKLMHDGLRYDQWRIRNFTWEGNPFSLTNRSLTSICILPNNWETRSIPPLPGRTLFQPLRTDTLAYATYLVGTAIRDCNSS